MCALPPFCFGNAAPMASTGLSPLWPCAWLHFMTAAIRRRTRLAVSGLIVQIGRRTPMTSAELIWSTRRRPSFGKT